MQESARACSSTAVPSNKGARSERRESAGYASKWRSQSLRFIALLLLSTLKALDPVKHASTWRMEMRRNGGKKEEKEERREGGEEGGRVQTFPQGTGAVSPSDTQYRVGATHCNVHYYSIVQLCQKDVP